MKRLPLATTEILKHFVFVIPPSEELSLLDEKREGEADAELSGTLGSGKVRSKPATCSPDLGRTSVGQTGKVTLRMVKNRVWCWVSHSLMCLPLTHCESRRGTPREPLSEWLILISTLSRPRGMV